MALLLIRRYHCYRPKDPSLLTRAEAASQIGVSVSTLERWAHLGRGPAYRRIGQSTYYAKADIQNWMAALDRLGGC